LLKEKWSKKVSCFAEGKVEQKGILLC